MITLQEFLNHRSNNFNERNTQFILLNGSYNIADYEEIIRGRENILMHNGFQLGKSYRCEYLISFVGIGHMKSLFLGILKTSLESENFENSFLYYKNIEMSEFRDLYGRLVVDWRPSGQARQASYNKKLEVVEIFPSNYHGMFPGVLNFVLSYDDLYKIVKTPYSNKNWVSQLSSINGIYMILDSKTDFQYIGSAYGQRGIYGCWEDYAFNQHGGNKYLIELIERDPFYYRNFKFSILQALPNDVSEKEIDKLKYTWIRKLGICRTKALN